MKPKPRPKKRRSARPEDRIGLSPHDTLESSALWLARLVEASALSPALRKAAQDLRRHLRGVIFLPPSDVEVLDDFRVRRDLRGLEAHLRRAEKTRQIVIDTLKREAEAREREAQAKKGRRAA